eukprot:22017-Eustigmatos_ZCMA.PRE.1
MHRRAAHNGPRCRAAQVYTPSACPVKLVVDPRTCAAQEAQFETLCGLQAQPVSLDFSYSSFWYRRDDPRVLVARVEGPANPELLEQLDIQTYPSIKLVDR